MPVWDLVRLIGRAIPHLMKNLDFLIIMAVILLFVHSQYRRIATLENYMLGTVYTDPVRETAVATVYGMIGGLVGSVVFIGIGLSLSETGIWYMWPLALLLMLIHPRLLCFSYAGGIVATAHLLLGWPDIDVPSAIALVAVLHMVEGLLIRLSGYQNPSPIYVRTESGEVVGGLSLQKFWPLPVLALVLVTVGSEMQGAELISMPDWWPLIRPDEVPPAGRKFLYILFPVVAALGYGDISISRLPRRKAAASAFHLFCYSFILLVVAIAADSVAFLRWIAALGAPLGHEWVIRRGQQTERRLPPIFRSVRGAMVLAVLPGSPAETMGLAPGDIIVKVNDYPIYSKYQLFSTLSPWIINPRLQIDGTYSGRGDRLLSYKGKIPPLGVIMVPDPDERKAVSLQRSGLLGRWMRRRE